MIIIYPATQGANLQSQFMWRKKKSIDQQDSNQNYLMIKYSKSSGYKWSVVKVVKHTVCNQLNYLKYLKFNIRAMKKLLM